MRDKYFAHFDKKYISNTDIPQIGPILFAEVEDVITLSCDILKKYSNGYDGLFIDIQRNNNLDLYRILDIVHEYT